MLADKKNVPKGMKLMDRAARDAAINRAIKKNDDDYKAYRGTAKAGLSALPDTKSINERIAAQNKLVIASKAASQAQTDEIKKIQALRKPAADRVADIDKQIAAERKLQATANKTIQDQTGKQIASARKTADLKARKATVEPVVARADAEVKAIKDGVTAEKNAADARIAAQKLLTDQIRNESAQRLAVIRAELRELNSKKMAETRQVRAGNKLIDDASGRRTQITDDQQRIRDLNTRAQLIQSRLTDPGSIRRIGNTLRDSPGSNDRGIRNLIDETRRAGDAQRFLNGQVSSGNSAFSSMKSQMMGMLSAYALFTVATTQASAAIDAFMKKEAFQITVSNTMGGDMQRAAGEFDYLTATANKYGFAISSISQEYAKLAATARSIGRSDKDLRVMFEGVLSVGRVNALSDEKMQDAFRAISQVLSKNQVYAEELKGQLAEALPAAVVRFAQAQGYGPDQMKAFSKALEEGAFNAKDIIEYAQQELDDNAAAVFRAQDTYQAVMARFQNTLFKSRADVAENGFMDGLKDTVKELDAFFKSDDGKAYMIRLGEGAQMVVGALASVAKNLDTIMTVVGGLALVAGGSVLGKMFTSMAKGARDATSGIANTGTAANTATRSLAVMGAGVRGLIGMLGGIPGIALLAAGAIWSIASGKNAADAAEAQSRLDRITAVFGEIGSAAVMAGDDVDDFIKRLNDIPGLSDSKRKVLEQDLKQSRVDMLNALKDARNEMAAEVGGYDTGGQAAMRGVAKTVADAMGWEMPDVSKDFERESPAMAEFIRLGEVLADGNFEMEAFQKQVNEFTKNNPGFERFGVILEDTATALSKNAEQTESLSRVTKGLAGDTEALTEESERYQTCLLYTSPSPRD